MKIKALTILMMISACLIAGTSRADVLFSDDFESYANLPDDVLSWGFAGLSAVAPEKWTANFATSTSLDAKVGPGKPGIVYWSGNDATITSDQILFYKAIVPNLGADCSVSFDYIKLTDKNTDDGNGNGLPDYEDYAPTVMVAARVTDTAYVAGYITLADWFNADGGWEGGTEGTYNEIWAGIEDSAGNKFGDYCQIRTLDPALPINLKLDIAGENVTFTITHNGETHVLTMATSILDKGTAAIGIKKNGYSKAYFDNFLVEGTPYFESIDGDINGDRVVDLADLAIMAADWAKCTDPADATCDTYWK